MPFIERFGSRRTLGIGAEGEDVRSLQQSLKKAGYQLDADGVFGPRTDRAVRTFQSQTGLDSDGLVGGDTWSALDGNAANAPELRVGARGGRVESLQRALQQAGYNPGRVDGVFGGGTQSALTAFQSQVGLAATGALDSRTWQALQGQSRFEPAARTASVTARPAPSTTTASARMAPQARASSTYTQELRQRMLELARGELGTLERTNNNDGAVMKYPRYFGRGREPYCADFVSYVATEAGFRMNFAYTPYMVRFLKERGQWKGKENPEPGDLVFFDFKPDRVVDHVGLVESVNADGSITTIEGNTENPSTGREGVMRRIRQRSEVYGYGWVG